MGLLRVVLPLFSSYVGVIETIRCVICEIASPLPGLYGGQDQGGAKAFSHFLMGPQKYLSYFHDVQNILANC